MGLKEGVTTNQVEAPTYPERLCAQLVNERKDHVGSRLSAAQMDLLSAETRQNIERRFEYKPQEIVLRPGEARRPFAPVPPSRVPHVFIRM